MLLADAFGHVVDSKYWEFFETGHIGFNLPFGLSKFIALELIAVGLVFAIMIPFANRMRANRAPTGKWDRLIEWMLAFVREKIVRPNLGDHEGDKFVPFFWTLFFFIFFNNVIGLLPWMGSATASLAVTGTLALIAFAVIHGVAIQKQGIGHYLGHHFPHIDAPFGLGVPIAMLICGIELFGHLIKAFVLAVRLFANMFAGHLVLAFIMSFIIMAKDNMFAFWPVSIGSVIMIGLLSVLELFVAWLQAYVFSYLTALFMGAALHPQH